MNNNDDNINECWEEIKRVQNEKKKLLINIMINVQKVKEFTKKLLSQTDKERVKIEDTDEEKYETNDNINNDGIQSNLNDDDDEIYFQNSVENLKNLFEGVQDERNGNTNIITHEVCELKGKVSSLITQFGSNDEKIINTEEKSSTCDDIIEGNVSSLVQKFKSPLKTNSNEDCSNDLVMKNGKAYSIIEEFTMEKNELQDEQEPNDYAVEGRISGLVQRLKTNLTTTANTNKDRKRSADESCTRKRSFSSLIEQFSALINNRKDSISDVKTPRRLSTNGQIKSKESNVSPQILMWFQSNNKNIKRNKDDGNLIVNEEATNASIEASNYIEKKSIKAEEVSKDKRRNNNNDNGVNNSDITSLKDLNNNFLSNLIDVKDYDKEFEILCDENDVDNVDVKDFDKVLSKSK